MRMWKNIYIFRLYSNFHCLNVVSLDPSLYPYFCYPFLPIFFLLLSFLSFALLPFVFVFRTSNFFLLSSFCAPSCHPFLTCTSTSFCPLCFQLITSFYSCPTFLFPIILSLFAPLSLSSLPSLLLSLLSCELTTFPLYLRHVLSSYFLFL